MSGRLRTGVVGGGLIAQAIHLPNLAALDHAFELVGIADPSPTVVDALARRYAANPYADWRALLERERLDAIVVCSPHATHAEIALAALDAGVHVFVEKPLCISVEDADAICARREQTGLVVQVGYMKRFDPAYEAFVGALPDRPEGLRFVEVVTYDPWMAREPFVAWDRLVHADDVPAAVLEAGRHSEQRQVEQAVGRGDPGAVRVYSYTFLACLIHDVNLVHGALERLGVTDPAVPVAASDWADGKGASVTWRLPGGLAWQCTWLLLEEQMDFRERATFYFADGIHALELPAPYLRGAAARHTVTRTDGARNVASGSAIVGDAYVAELEHFHACVVDGGTCRTPPEQARADIALLQDAFCTRVRDTAPLR